MQRALPRSRRGGGLELIRRGARVEGVEEVGRPQLLQEQAHPLPDRLQREAVAVPGLLGGEEVPAEGVGAEGIENVPGLHRVALGLGHLLTLLIEDQPEAHHVPVRRRALQQDGDRQQRVEPAARLILRLADEVRGKALRELAQVLERVVVLGEGHRARVEPHVDHLRHASHRRPAHGAPLAVRAGELERVDVWPVVIGEGSSGELLEL